MMQVSVMWNRARVQFTTLALLVFVISDDAFGASEDAKTRAAALFEQGVRQFSSADYEAAAETFLAADALVESDRALINGITAARRAGLHLIVVHAAERALARPDLDPGGRSLAREALTEAARNLSVIDATCAPAPCTLTMDGAPIQPGHEYVLPGAHDFVAAGENGASATVHLGSVAGTAYRVSLTPEAPGTTEGTAPRPKEELVPAPRPDRRSDVLATRRDEHRKPLPPAAFVAGAIGTVALVALTTWSGVDTLSARSDAQSAPGTWPHVERLALRTDLLLTGALVLGAATGAAGLWFVDWGTGQRAAAMLLPGGGAAFAARGQF
jgi:hypothetical protein